MITLSAAVNNAIKNDEPIAWLLLVALDSATYYWGVNLPVTIPMTANYVGGFVMQGGLGELEQSIDVLEGGNLDQVGSLKIRLNNFADENFVHTMFPPFSGNQWINRRVQIGIVQFDAPSSADIVWLYAGRIDHAEFTLQEVMLEVMDEQEQYEQDLPRTLIDRDAFSRAPEDSIGKPLPILYGNYLTPNTISTPLLVGGWRVCPAICVDGPLMKFVVAGHVCHSAGATQIYRTSAMKGISFLEIETSAGVFNSPTTDVDDAGMATISLPAGNICCLVISSFALAGKDNTVTNFYNAINQDVDTTVAEVEQGGEEVLALQIDGLPSGQGKGNFSLFFRVIGAHKFTTGYLLDGEGMGSFHPIASYEGLSTDEDGPLDVISIDGVDTIDLLTRQWIVRCSGSGEHADVSVFGYLAFITLTQRKMAATKKRRSD